jgi:hypothetical protein
MLMMMVLMFLKEQEEMNHQNILQQLDSAQFDKTEDWWGYQIVHMDMYWRDVGCVKEQEAETRQV